MIINVNKPKGITSRDVVNTLSHHFKTKKVGHTGTLDPIATGVLIVCTEEDTKLVELLTSENKEYEVEMQLGIKTDTGDITGEVIEENYIDIDEEDLKVCINNFIKTYLQEVPLYSAVKVNGKKLYEYARLNEKVELPKREVTIYSNNFIDKNENLVKFRVSVSKGTYIRSLINDICAELNTIGTMTNLKRISQGEYRIEDSNEIEDIEQNNFKTIKRSEVLKDFPYEKVTKENETLITNGSLITKTFDSKYLVYTDENDEIIAIYMEYPKDKTLAKPYKMF